jgi:hypothetical protein
MLRKVVPLLCLCSINRISRLFLSSLLIWIGSYISMHMDLAPDREWNLGLGLDLTNVVVKQVVAVNWI